MRAVIAVAALALMVAPVRAQCYRTSGCSYPVQTYQSYYQPVYQAQVQYVPHYETYSQSAIVGAAYPVYLPLLSYGALADDVRSYYSQKKAIKDAYLEALREAAGEGIFGGQPQPQPGPFVPPPGVESRGAANPNPPPSVPNPPAAPPVPKAPGAKGQIGKLLATRCATCHNPEKEPEHVDLSIPADRIPWDVRSLCVTWCSDSTMPKTGAKLSQTEFDEIQAWAKAARPTLAKAIPPAQPADKK